MIFALFALLFLLAVSSQAAPDDTRRIVPAEEILEKIERGEPVEYDNVIVVGDLDLNKVDLPTKHVKVIEYISITIEEITIEEITPQIMWSSDIRTTWNDEANVVNSSISIEDSEIQGYVNFENVIFQKSIDFGSTNLSSDSNFKDAQFSGYTDFRDAQFSGYTDFRDAQFSSDAYFWRAQFSGNADFRDAQFSSDAHFRDAQFSGNADFEGAQFRNTLDLSYLNFTHMHMFLEWNSVDRLICDGVTYLQLIKNFKDLEQFEDADNCYYNYRKSRMLGHVPSWSTPVDILAGLTCGYGVRPGYTLFWSLAVVLVFGFVFWTGNGIHRVTSIHKENSNAKTRTFCPSSFCRSLRLRAFEILRRIWRAPKKDAIARALLFPARFGPRALARALKRLWNAELVIETSLKDALYFSALVFVSQPPPDWRPKEGWRYAVMTEDVLGWLLLALFLVTLGNVMIR